MKSLEVDQYILEECENALRLAANCLDSRKRTTAADRQIEYAERLMKWVLNGKQGERPRVIPTKEEKSLHIVNQFTVEEIETAKRVKNQVIEGDMPEEIRTVYMAGEICMYDELNNAPSANTEDTKSWIEWIERRVPLNENQRQYVTFAIEEVKRLLRSKK